MFSVPTNTANILSKLQGKLHMPIDVQDTA